MQSTNLSNTHTINISLFDKKITDDIFQDFRFVQLMNLLIKTQNKYKYSYCFYCDQYSLKTNIFIPIFHTMYLACNNNNVLIKNSEDLWLLETFKNNKYFVLKNNNDTFDYSGFNITQINDIKEIEGLLI